MCGIAGLLTKSPSIAQTLEIAEDIQRRRGPDAQSKGIYKVDAWHIGFAHQRLAVIDLTDAGIQPMTAQAHGDRLIFNGEIYNYLELRAELESKNYHFKTNTDTEVLINALDCWGIEDALGRFNGMWAFAWLCYKEKRLYLARDRAGIKPLYYYQAGDQFYFASEIKTILAMSKDKFSLNHQVIASFISQSLLDVSDGTMFDGVERISGGSYLEIDLSCKSIVHSLKHYWSLDMTPNPIESERQLILRVREVFLDAVELRMRGDVPVGVLLSGGIDSTAIACAMKAVSGRGTSLKLLSAVSHNSNFDESSFIDIAQAYLGSVAHKVSMDLSPQEAFEALKNVIWINDEPISNFSVVFHHQLMAVAKQLGLTIILSGQGADEILCGYRKYLGFYLQYLIRHGEMAKATSLLYGFVNTGTVISQLSFSDAKRYLPRFLRGREADIRGPRLANSRPLNVGLNGSTVQERQARDLTQFSVPQLTHYEDRMSMDFGREVRLPFLDHRFIELLIPLEPNYKLRNGWTKYIFRKALEPYMPSAIAWRRDKKNFVNPQETWLKHELHSNVTTYFQEDSLMFQSGLIDRQTLVTLYEAYLRQGWQNQQISYKDILNPLSLELWLRSFEAHLSL